MLTRDWRSTHNDADTKADTPDAVTWLTLVGGDDNQRYDTRAHKARDDGSVGRNSNEHATALLHGLSTIGTLHSLCGADGVLSA